MKEIALQVNGMSCQNCVKAVNRTLGFTEGVESCEVDLEGGRVNVNFDEAVIAHDKIADIIDDLGFEVVR
jgi:copper chaperone